MTTKIRRKNDIPLYNKRRLEGVFQAFKRYSRHLNLFQTFKRDISDV